MSTRSLQGSLQVLANPYSRGAVVFNSTPYTQFYMQQQQKEQAKDEALDKYFMNWDKSINPAGMRHIETQDLLTLTNENKVFYFKNKKSIKNPSLDNGAAYNEWSSRSQSAMGLISQSKELADRGKIINAAIIQAKQKGLPLTDKVVEDLKAFDKSVKSKDWRDFNINNLDFQPKQFDPTRFTKDIFSDIKLSDKLESEVKKPETMQILQTWTSSIDKANLPLIKQRASAAYYSNKSVKFEVDMYLNDANKYQELNKVFKDKFKTDIKNGEDMATALALSLSPIGKPFEKVVDDWVARSSYSNAKQDARARIIASGKGGQSTDAEIGNIFDEIDSPKELQGGYKISKGQVLKDNQPYSGDIYISKDFIPAQMYSALKAMGTDGGAILASKGFTATVEGGIIEYLTDKRLGKISRSFMQNAQKKLDTEPAKGAKMGFGKGTSGTMQSPKSIRYTDNGVTYNIPEKEVGDFLKSKPKAKIQK